MSDNQIIANKYLRLLGSKKTLDAIGFREKAIVHVPIELSAQLGEELLDKTKDRLFLEYEKSQSHDEAHKELIARTLLQARESLSIIGNENPEFKLVEKQVLALEAIVIANGTRPSLKYDDLKNEKQLDFGEWENSFLEFKEQIVATSRSVGRIDSSNEHRGTGFVVAPGLIMTNRHVLLSLAEEVPDSKWNFKGSASISFGEKKYEILPEVAYSGFGDVNEEVDFNNIDMAILRCREIDGFFPPPLKFKQSESDVMKGRYAYIIGFPGKPGPGYENFIVLRKLFNFEFGVKRISPGEIDSAIGDVNDDIHGRVFEHDCTTLGGSSGSPVIDFDETGTGVFGLHFAGAKRISNFAHATAVFRDELEDLGLVFE